MFCPHCGMEVASDTRLCGQCGAPLKEAAADASNAAAGSTPSGTARATGPGEAAGIGRAAPAAGTHTGLQRNVAGLLCYALGWLTGIIFYLIEKDTFVRFHAMQSILTFGGFTAVYFVTVILLPMSLWRLWPVFHALGTLLWLASTVLWVLLMVKAYQGHRYKLPVVGDLAERYAEQ